MPQHTTGHAAGADDALAGRARLARAFALASIVLVMMALLLVSTQDRQPIPQLLIGRGGNALFTAVCAIVGLLIVTHRPGNLIGWIYSAVSLAFALGEFAGTYTTRAQASTPRYPGRSGQPGSSI